MSALALGLPRSCVCSSFRPLAEHGLDACQVAPGLAHLHRVGELGGGPLEAQVEELVGELVLARAQLDIAHVARFLWFHAAAPAAWRSRGWVASESLAAARRSASFALVGSTPSISNSMRPGFTTATHTSGEPLPLPMRVSAGFLVSGLSGKTRTQTRPPRFR